MGAVGDGVGTGWNEVRAAIFFFSYVFTVRDLRAPAASLMDLRTSRPNVVNLADDGPSAVDLRTSRPNVDTRAEAAPLLRVSAPTVDTLAAEEPEFRVSAANVDTLYSFAIRL